MQKNSFPIALTDPTRDITIRPGTTATIKFKEAPLRVDPKTLTYEASVILTGKDRQEYRFDFSSCIPESLFVAFKRRTRCKMKPRNMVLLLELVGDAVAFSLVRDKSVKRFTAAQEFSEDVPWFDIKGMFKRKDEDEHDEHV